MSAEDADILTPLHPNFQALSVSLYTLPVYFGARKQFNQKRFSMLDFLTFISQQWLLVSLLLLFIYAFVWRESKKGGTSVSSHQLTRMVNADEAVLIDIREAKEFNSGHIAGATNIPYAKIQSRINEFGSFKDKTIILIDKYGQQTGAAGRELTKAGYQPARLQGGMADWQANNMPVIRKD